MNMSLYSLAQEHRVLVEILMESEHDAQTIMDTLEGESYSLETKAKNVAYAVKNLEALAGSIKQAEADMAARRKSVEKRAEHLREYTKTCMEIAGVSKIECPHFALSIKKNPPSVEVWDEKQIPARFLRAPEPPPLPAPVPDKKAIAEALKKGEEVFGAMLAQGTRLEIK